MSSLLGSIIQSTIFVGVVVGGIIIIKASLTPQRSVLTDSRFRKKRLNGGKTRKHKN